MLLNNQWINDEIKTEIKQYMETNDNNNSTAKSVGCTKAVLRGNYIAIQANLRKEEQSHMNSLNSQLMKPQKEEKIRPKVSKRRDIIKIRALINKIEENKTTESMKAGDDFLIKLTKSINP